jgi:Mg2+/citrate symporter
VELILAGIIYVAIIAVMYIFAVIFITIDLSEEEFKDFLDKLYEKEIR